MEHCGNRQGQRAAYRRHSGERTPGSLFIILYLAIIAVVYSVALDAPFVYDDRIHILENPLVLGFHSVFDAASWKALVQTPFGWAGRPLLFLTYGITNASSGLDASSFRIANIAIHFINALLVFAIARLLAGAVGRSRGESAWIAWVSGLLFAVHPLATESVAYVAGRSSSLCALFYFSGIVVVYLNLGVVRLRQHRYAEAKEMIERARRLNPLQLMIGLNLGVIAFNMLNVELVGQVYLVPGATDLRKSIDGLSALVAAVLT